MRDVTESDRTADLQRLWGRIAPQYVAAAKQLPFADDYKGLACVLASREWRTLVALLGGTYMRELRKHTRMADYLNDAAYANGCESRAELVFRFIQVHLGPVFMYAAGMEAYEKLDRRYREEPSYQPRFMRILPALGDPESLALGQAELAVITGQDVKQIHKFLSEMKTLLGWRDNTGSLVRVVILCAALYERLVSATWPEIRWRLFSYNTDTGWPRG